MVGEIIYEHTCKCNNVWKSMIDTVCTFRQTIKGNISQTHTSAMTIKKLLDYVEPINVGWIYL